ncbi:MAG: copper/zinc binding superoxide dismutase, partial [Bacillus sp. (in: firmicutes)]|nr:copper/zinc binding superoxide dismutase [Bacillus sp. (in: firmicutes)]
MAILNANCFLGMVHEMKKLLLLLPILLMTGCAEENPTKLDVEMFNSVGDSMGTIKLQEQSSGVKMAIDLKGLQPGEHAI